MHQIYDEISWFRAGVKHQYRTSVVQISGHTTKSKPTEENQHLLYVYIVYTVFFLGWGWVSHPFTSCRCSTALVHLHQVRDPAGCRVPVARQLALALHHRGGCDLHPQQHQGNGQGGWQDGTGRSALEGLEKEEG